MILPNFKERLSELMIENDLSPTTLGAKIGSSRMTINRYLQGSRTPSVEFLIILADFFHCTMDYLIGLDEENYSTIFVAPPPFSQRILELCEIYGKTRYEIQHKTQISMASIYSWQQNPRYPTIDNILRLAEFFGCTVDYVIGRTKS